jgi:hypothetical protein
MAQGQGQTRAGTEAQRLPAIEAVHDPGTIPAPGGARGPWIAILGLVIGGPRLVGGDSKEDR